MILVVHIVYTSCNVCTTKNKNQNKAQLHTFSKIFNIENFRRTYRRLYFDKTVFFKCFSGELSEGLCIS